MVIMLDCMIIRSQQMSMEIMLIDVSMDVIFWVEKIILLADWVRLVKSLWILWHCKIDVL